MASNKKGKKYKCPYCDYRDYRAELIDHVEEEHEEMIPKGYTAGRVVYNTINKKDHGKCMVCHKETKWDEDKQRYDSLCGRPKCKQEYVKIVRSRMVKKYGTYNLLTNPEFQKKMLENRSISGKYKFQDGGSVGYVGSYEKKFLEFMDAFLHIKSYDIISPGPNIPYMYKGKEHVWITDFIYEPYNLVFDIKDGGDNPNTRDMVEYREKQLAKEKAIAEYGDYNYIRLTDNKFDQLISIFMELKEKTDDKPLIRINESFLNEETTEYMDKLTAFHLEPVIPNKKRPIGGWDEELYSKNMEYAILNDIKSNWRVKDQTSVKAYVFTAGKDLKAIYLGTIYIPDKNKSGWEWDEKEMLSDDAYDYLKLNPMESTLLNEETRIDKDKLPKFIYHISAENHDGETFEPRKYDNDNVKNDMERYVARVCFADSVDGCLYSIFPNGAYDAEFYIHVPGHEVKVYSTTKDDVYDSEITHELWVKEPIKMKCIGKIKVTGVSNTETKVIDIESDKVPYNKKKYHKCIWKWVEKYDKDKSLFEFYIEEDKDEKSFKIIGEFIKEEAMSSKERNELDDDEFGIPELRKYPLHDKKHVEQAIKMFNHVEKKYEDELADNLLHAMEKYRISTDVVGDKNRLKKYIKEETVYVSEGLIWNDNTPKDIKDLKEDIKENIKNDTDLQDIVDAVKDSLKNKDFSSEEKGHIYKILKKVHVNIDGYTIKTASYGSAELSNTHQIIGTYKNYIITLKFIGAKGNIGLTSIAINYDEDKCEVPKNVAFDFVSMLSPHIDKVSSTKRSIKISALSNAIDSGYPRVSHKYGNKYNVKKSIGGLYIKLSTIKFVKESAIAGAMHRQDYQPDAVYIVNYLKKNTFVNDLAICKDKMSSIFVCDETGPFNISLTDFKEMVEDIKVYRFNGECDFNTIIESSKCGLDFYKNIVKDNIDISNLKSDPHFTEVVPYIDELKSIEECIINSAPKTGIVNEVYCPIIPLVNMNVTESSVHYFRDIDGVFAQNIDTLHRSASYKSVDDIPKTTISILKNI